MSPVYLLLIICLPASAASYDSFMKRRSNNTPGSPPDSCAAGRHECGRTGQVRAFFRRHQLTDLLQASTFQLFCHGALQYARCDRSYVAFCGTGVEEGHVDTLTMMRTSVQSICQPSSGVYDLLHAASASPCVSDPSLGLVVKKSVQRCLYRLYLENMSRADEIDPDSSQMERIRHGICPLLAGYKTCIVNSVTQVCGENAGQAVDTVTDYFIAAFNSEVACP